MNNPLRNALVVPFGDVSFFAGFRVNGLKRYGIRLHFGVPKPTTSDERPPFGQPVSGRSQTMQKGTGSIMDLAADHKVPVSVVWTDEVGNAVPTPAEALVAYASSDTSVLTVTDNGDGTAEAVATGALGSAVLSVSASLFGSDFSGEETVNVVAGLAERVSMEFGEPVEVTPDDV